MTAPIRTTRDLTAAVTAVSIALVRSGTDTRLVASSDGEIARAIAAVPAGAAQAEESELYRRFAHRVRMYGRKHLRDEAAADDLAQQVMLVTIEKLRAGEIRNADEIGSFILGTSRMQAGSMQRRARRRESLTARFHVPEISVDPSDAAPDIEAMERCLGRLAERDRRVLILSFYAEKASPQIAEELGVTATVVRVARHRALGRLRDCVGLQGARTA